MCKAKANCNGKNELSAAYPKERDLGRDALGTSLPTCNSNLP